MYLSSRIGALRNPIRIIAQISLGESRRLTVKGRVQRRREEQDPPHNLVEDLQLLISLAHTQTDNVPSDSKCHHQRDLSHGH